MPTSGLSLVGFMDKDTALQHLTTACVPDPNDDEQKLLGHWQQATAQLGPPTANAGYPGLTAIPLAHPHVAALLNLSPWSPQLNTHMNNGSSFQMIEIATLLAFQYTVDKDRSLHHCNLLSSPPTQDELLSLCLPVSPAMDQVHFSPLDHSVIIRSRSLNLRLINRGPIQGAPNAIGIQFGFTMPHVHVVRYNGRCYLHNGYHRVYGSKMAGATHVPCLFRDVQDADGIGNKPGGFDLALLKSGNPPTMEHFTNGSAWPVRMRAASRILQINWSEHVLFEE
jgi:hypothetical protein